MPAADNGVDVFADMLSDVESNFTGPFIYRINDTASSGPNLLVQVCQERGWREFVEGTNNWNLWWRTGGASNSLYKHIRPWQIGASWAYDLKALGKSFRMIWLTMTFLEDGPHFTNHIPKGSMICRKDRLVQALRTMKRVYGTIYEISPHSYNLPQEYTKLISEYSRRSLDNEKSRVWISKPIAQSQGRGIFLFRNLSDLCNYTNLVVQRYIEEPLLVAGYKFDLRLYVCVPSFHPLRVYIYREGLVRFSTERFSLADLSNTFCHLTNTSLNKVAPGYPEMKERIGAEPCTSAHCVALGLLSDVTVMQRCETAASVALRIAGGHHAGHHRKDRETSFAGCKWTLQQLRRHLSLNGKPDWLLWQRVCAIVVLTVLSQSRGVPRTANCFEFYGFDVLVDQDMRPWVLEVNLSPALGVDCDVDPAVKKPMLHDMFDLLGLPVLHTGLSLYQRWSNQVPPALSASTLSLEDNDDISEHSARSVFRTWRKKSCQSDNSVCGARCRQRPKSSSSPFVAETIKTVKEPAKRRPATARKSLYASASSRKSREKLDVDDFGAAPINGGPSGCGSAWGNGRDWFRAPAEVGDWVRAYPLGDAAMRRGETHERKLNGADGMDLVPVGDAEVKAVVAAMARFLRVARSVHLRRPTMSDAEHNRLVMNTLNDNIVFWCPPR